MGPSGEAIEAVLRRVRARSWAGIAALTVIAGIFVAAVVILPPSNLGAVPFPLLLITLAAVLVAPPVGAGVARVSLRRLEDLARKLLPWVDSVRLLPRVGIVFVLTDGLVLRARATANAIEVTRYLAWDGRPLRVPIDEVAGMAMSLQALSISGIWSARTGPPEERAALVAAFERLGVRPGVVLFRRSEGVDGGPRLGVSMEILRWQGALGGERLTASLEGIASFLDDAGARFLSKGPAGSWATRHP